VLGWGDGLAPVIGTRFGKMKYHILSDKSIEGSLAFFVGSVAAGLFFVKLILPESFDPLQIIVVSLIATVVEGVSPKEVDNLTIPLAVILALRFV
ncbi:MAG: phosphatidate cytidylyltransferase, partial [Chlorobiaceae bacterium]|nr:phosphatidate cytidylyltransferase [Chlorobiaceae bacterium]